VWVWAPGIFAPGGAGNPAKISGFKLQQDDTLGGKAIETKSGADRLMDGVPALLGVEPWESGAALPD